MLDAFALLNVCRSSDDRRALDDSTDRRASHRHLSHHTHPLFARGLADIGYDLFFGTPRPDWDQQQETMDVVRSPIQTNKTAITRTNRTGKVMDGTLYWIYIVTTWLNAHETCKSPSRPSRTSEVSQFKGNDNSHTIGMVRFHANCGQLRVGVVEVKKCELAKHLSGPPVGNRFLVRYFIEEGKSGATCSPLNVVMKCIKYLG